MQHGELSVLGPTTLVIDGQPARIRPREAAVLAALALVGGPIQVDDLMGLLWAEPPATAAKSIHNHVVRLRQLDPHLVVTEQGGYRLGSQVAIDRDRVERLVGDRAADPGRAPALAAALAGWTGPGYAELPDHPTVLAERARLAELRLGAEEQLVALRLLEGATPDVAAEAERLVAQEPYREARWWLLMLARHRAGRRRDALQAYQDARRALVEGVGIEPGASLRALEAQVLADDPGLLTSRPLTGEGAPLAPASRASERRRRPRRPRRLVGRDEVRARVVDLLASAPGRPVLVVGEAGIGKTTLAQAVVEALEGRGGTVLATAGEPTPDGALRPVGRVVDAIVDRHGPATVSAWAADDLASLGRVAERLSTGPAPDAMHGPVGDALGRLLARLQAHGAVAVVVDDAHLVPPSSARAIAAAHRMADGAGLLLLARRGPLPRAFEEVGPEVVALEGLDQRGVADYLAEVAPDGVAPEVVEHLRARSGGNPLLLGEIVAHDAVRARLRAGASASALAEVEQLSDSVAAFTRQRLADLAASTVRVLEAASVIGPSVRRATLEAVVGPCDREVADAIDAGLLVPGVDGDGLEFRHQLVRDAIYASASPGSRAELHETVAQVLEAADEGSWDRIAHHLVAVADLDPDRALRACRRAAREAFDQFAYREAAAHHATVVDLLRRSGRDRTEAGAGEVADALIDQGEALHQAGDPAGDALLVAAADDAEARGDADRLGRALLCLCRLGVGSDAGGADTRLADRIRDALAMDLRPDILAELAGGASLLHSMDADPTRCREHYELAEATARAAAPETLSRVLPFAYLGLAHPDLLERRAAVAEELIALADGPAARFSGFHQRFSVEVQLGQPGFRASHEEMARLARLMATPGHRWTTSYNEAVVRYLDGDLDGSERAAEAALAEPGIAPSRRLSIYGIQLVAIRRAQDRLGELDDDVRRLVREQPDVAGWRVVSLAVAAALGDHDRVRSEHDAIAADGYAGVPDDFTRSACALLVVDAVATTGDEDRIRAALPLLDGLRGRLSWAGTTTVGSIDLVAARAEAAIGDAAAARRSQLAAKRLATRMRAPMLLAEPLAAARP